jgi:ribonucleoside-diphosphate reductase alpha chain
MWEDVKDELLATQGDLSRIEGIPEHLQEVYKTSFQLSPYAFIEVAARAQKWIDQAISRNIYLEDRDVENMMALYAAAWERGVKTTYYLHMKPRHTAEQSTVRVNKTEKINTTGNASGKGSGSTGPAKRGFGGFGGAKSGSGFAGVGSSAIVDPGAPADETVVDVTGALAPQAPSPVVEASSAAPVRRGFGAVVSSGAVSSEAVSSGAVSSGAVAPAVAVSVADAAAVSKAEPRTGGISIAPASFMSALAAKAFAPAPEQKPVVPPSALPAIVEPAVVETASTAAEDRLDAYRAPEGATVLEVVETVYSADGDMEMVGGVACPVDPMERLQCESCQ